MGFVAAFRVFSLAFPALQSYWQLAFMILPIANMTFGNLVAVAQTSVKSMLAFSFLA
jgi:NADH-quinone oxidoreductase subunit N